jgi:hypothetical protein
VLLSDFLSTQVALSSLDGTTLSPSFLSTASRETDGLAFAFSGDVVLPSERPPSGRVVLIDRFGTNVISFANPRDARVLGQLPVATGFEANPYDYIEVDETRAYVSRFGHNGSPGREPFDAGDDVLIIDTRAYTLLDRIPLAVASDPVPPRPTRFARFGEHVIVALERASLDFSRLEDSELVALDPKDDSVSYRVTLRGMKGCGAPVPTLDGHELVVACTGALTVQGEVADRSSTGLVVLDATRTPPVERERFTAEALGIGAIQSDVAFLSERFLLLKTQTAISGTTNNRLLAWDRTSGEVQPLLEARPSSRGLGQGVVYGALACAPGCSDVCWLADADRGVLRSIRLDGRLPVVDGAVRVEQRTGLPPRGITYR